MPIRPRLLASVFAAATLASAPALAQSFEEGVAALGKGDDAQALRLFTEAAGQGDAKSQFALAEMYRQGQGAPADAMTALGWYRKAAEQGNPGAAYQLGLAYQSGRGLARSDHLAAQWFLKAAQGGYASAQTQIGAAYAQGRGVGRDDEEAALWLGKAAAQGDADAAHLMSRLAVRVSLTPNDRFRAMMDRVFGAGRWRETSGFRTVAQEEALRRQGAGVVALGERSRHSMGSKSAPGAYDVVVDDMPLQQAAAKLKRSREPLARVVAELAHGSQGPHLHVEPYLQPIANVELTLGSGDASQGR
jgi:TPR repeat protein